MTPSQKQLARSILQVFKPGGYISLPEVVDMWGKQEKPHFYALRGKLFHRCDGPRIKYGSQHNRTYYKITTDPMDIVKLRKELDS
tara:strand:- start:572 stop:826 length:255 start_codon:yes stop_codon:yes gene_type:complete